MMARARQLPGMTPAFDALLGIVASSDEPIAQGRHKVWGSRPLWVPPQTSTIASHLPKAMGLAFSLARARRLGVDGELPADAVVLCSFGDASANHATALAAINTARYAARVGLPMPILFVCEDNGTGISVPTPDDWIRETFSAQPHLRYVLASGELDEVWDATAEAVHYVRSSRQPAFLHLPVVRLWGHAGSDAEHAYRSAAQIAANEAEIRCHATRAGWSRPVPSRRQPSATWWRRRAAGSWPRPRRPRAGRGWIPPRRWSAPWRRTTRRAWPSAPPGRC